MVLSNPFMFRSTLDKIDSALTEAIDEIVSEVGSFGESGEEADLLAKFRQWRDEVGAIRAGRGARRQDASGDIGEDPERATGMFTD